VQGNAVPDVPFDIGESYAGLLPISGESDETPELYFWFFPTVNPAGTEEVVIWLDGGPGCSSLGGASERERTLPMATRNTCPDTELVQVGVVLSAVC
jgi:hypothetical protein